MDVQITDETLANAVENFIRSIQIELNPLSSPEDRQRAHIFCETFRTHEPISTVATVGIVLTAKSEVEVVFAGLRIIEDLTKYHWATIDCRDVIKTRLLYLLEHGFEHLPSQPGVIKEALARTIVEIAKREWPQLWPDLIPSLFALGKKSVLAYIVLRRLFEDISLCQVEENFPRKRELLQSFMAITTETVPILFQLLCTSLEEFSSCHTPLTVAKCKMFFGTILPFIELANLDLILESNRVNLLFQLTRHPVFKMDAAECILQLMQRKQERKEKAKVIAECMKDINFASFHEAIKEDTCEELHFVKQLCDMLGFFGSSCGKDRSSLIKFFTACESLASKSETAAVVGTAIAFHAFLRATVESDKECLQQADFTLSLESMLNLMVRKLVSAPVRTEKEDLGRLKGEFCSILRLMSKVWPNLYLFITPWIASALNNPGSMEAFHWESLGSLIDTVTSTVSHEEENVVMLGLQHLEQAFRIYSSEENIQMKSGMLSTVSGLFVFLSLAKKKVVFTSQITNLMCSIIKSLFHCFSYSDSERVIRRHVASLFIKLAKDNGDLFLDMFDSIYQETINLREKLSSMEYVSLVECLLITSNRWENRTQQLNFIATLIAAPEWQQIASMCHSVTEFTTMFTEDVFYEKRKIFLRNLNLLVALFNRVQFPENSLDYVDNLFNLLRPALPVVLELTKTLHSLVLDPSTAFLMDMSSGERSALLGFIEHNSVEETDTKERSFKEKLQNFVRALKDAAYGVLGGCGPKFGYRFYSIPHIADAYLTFVGHTRDQMNDFNIRRFLRMVYKPFLLSCPYDYMEQVMIPFLQEFGAYMMQRLSARWQLVDFESMDDENAPSEEAEIVENASLRLLTKEYFDIWIKLLVMSNTSSDDFNRSFYFAGGMDMDEDMQQNGLPKANPSSSGNDLGEVGEKLLEDIPCFQALVHLSANSLNWKFSQVNLKAARCLLLSMKYIGRFPDVVRELFIISLKAITQVKDVEVNFDSLFRIVDTIISEYSVYDPTILEQFKSWGASTEDITRIVNVLKGTLPANIKKRKEIIRNIVRIKAQENGPKSQWLTQLPVLMICTQKKFDKLEASLKEVDLRECFSLIHLS